MNLIQSLPILLYGLIVVATGLQQKANTEDIKQFID